MARLSLVHPLGIQRQCARTQAQWLADDANVQRDTRLRVCSMNARPWWGRGPRMLARWFDVAFWLGVGAATITAQAVHGPNARVVNSTDTLASAISDGVAHIVVAAHITSIPTLPDLKPGTLSVRVRHASETSCDQQTS
jgi:hypothetical protein